jgi:hypothetical protein
VELVVLSAGRLQWSFFYGRQHGLLAKLVERALPQRRAKPIKLAMKPLPRTASLFSCQTLYFQRSFSLPYMSCSTYLIQMKPFQTSRFEIDVLHK